MIKVSKEGNVSLYSLTLSGADITIFLFCCVVFSEGVGEKKPHTKPNQQTNSYLSVTRQRL